MPTTKPRITLTLEPHVYEVLRRLSAASGDSMSEIVAEIVGVAVPSLERVVVVLERARAAPQEVRAGLAAAIDRAERQFLPAVRNALDHQDLFFADMEGATRAPKRRSTPGPVTRGSGTGKTRKKPTRRGKV